MQEINLYKLLKYYLSNWLVVVIFVIAGLIAGVIYNGFIQTPSYKSSATIFVVGADQSAISKESTLINNYIELMTSRRVLDPVISELKLNKDYDQLVGAVSVSNQKDTAVVKLTVATDNPETSKAIANSTIESFKKQIKDLYGGENIQVVDGASLPTSPYNVRKSLQLVLFTGAGLLVSIIILFFIYDYKQTTDDLNTNSITSRSQKKSAPKGKSKAKSSTKKKTVAKSRKK